MRFSLIHPSRGRPDRAFANFLNWMGKAGKDHPVEHILSLDSDDPHLERYRELFKGNSNIVVNDNGNMVQATNHGALHSSGDVLILLSDDFDCPDKWNDEIAEASKVAGDYWLMKVDDCLQPFNNQVITIPIMNRPAYNGLDYIYHPDYSSMWVDVDLFYECKARGWLVNAPHLKFEHIHCSTGKCENDETYERSAAHWNTGLETFKRRKQQNKWRG